MYKEKKAEPWYKMKSLKKAQKIQKEGKPKGFEKDSGSKGKPQKESKQEPNKTKLSTKTLKRCMSSAEKESRV